ncbi:MAG TPA: TonB-dependent receptor, partial [Rheinheimera sp.]|nr:TonB-dependent receptor [Rheinheimera sp.]
LTAYGQFSAQADVKSGFYEFDTSYGVEDEADTLNRAYVLGWQHQLGHWQHQAQLSRNLDSEATFGPGSRSPFVTARDEFSYQAASSITDSVSFFGGINWYQEQVDKSATAYEQTSRVNRALFTGITYQQSALQLEAAARRDLTAQYGGQNTWQLAAGYQLAEHWRVRASRGTAFKAPTFNDLYYPGFANPDLKPEESVSDEVAVSYQNPGLTVQLAWFDRDVTNLIQGVEQAENVLLATIEGVEFSLKQQWRQFNSQFAYSWLDTENSSTGTKLARRPENTLNWRGSYDADKWSVFITADYQSETYQGIDWVTGLDLPQAPTHTLWGVGGSYVVTDALTLRAKVDNLFDKDYFTSHSYATAGTTFGISLSYTPR